VIREDHAGARYAAPRLDPLFMRITSSFVAVLLAIAFLSTADLSAQQAPTDLQRVFDRAMAARDLGVPVNKVLEHLAGVPRKYSRLPTRLSMIDAMLSDVWSPPAVATSVRDTLSGAMQRGNFEFDGRAEAIAKWLDLADYTGAEASDNADLARLHRQWQIIADPEIEGMELLELLSYLLGAAHAILEQTLDGLDESERRLLFDKHADFCEAWYRSHFPKQEDRGAPEVAKLEKSYVAQLLVRPEVDRQKTLAVADVLSRLTSTAFARSLSKRLAKVRGSGAPVDGFTGDIRAVVGEDEFRVVLGGPKKSTYAAPAALIIDLGGDDVYHRAAVVDDETMLASVVVDLAGNDLYESSTPGPAYSVGGVAILADMRGKDRYHSGRLGQGASVLGFAMLMDAKGNDEYVLEDYGQGHSLCGIGLLYDLSGNDRYTAWAYAQGGGIGYGLSALIDGKGDDQYLADLHWPDVYGDSGPDVYHGASQGYATGIRSRTAGGIAALIDLGKGKDRYQAGSFSQAGGYFFSFGLMYDGGGDDENFGSRYAQGFGVHQGVGVRQDAGGDDLYRCRSVAHAGMAWDEGVGYFLEDGGDDVYELGALAVGGAAQTGVAICIDGAGKDRYQVGGQSLGGTGSSEYHDLPSIGIMIDLGGQKDSYPRSDRSDARFESTDGASVFIDCKDRTLRALARSRILK